MDRKSKITIFVLAILVLSGAVAFLYLYPVPFEQEYGRMSLAWKENGLSEEHLHASEDVFSMKEQEINKIKTELAAFRDSARSKPAGELAGVYCLFLEAAAQHAALSELQASLAESEKPLCENLSAYEELEKGFSSLRQKRNSYLNAVDSFAAGYPLEAEEISLHKIVTPAEDKSLEALLLAIDVVKEEC